MFYPLLPNCPLLLLLVEALLYWLFVNNILQHPALVIKCAEVQLFCWYVRMVLFTIQKPWFMITPLTPSRAA